MIDYVIMDNNLADFVRKELSIAETYIFVSIERYSEYGKSKPLNVVPIVRSTQGAPI